jgi:hypothetical protein
MVCWRDLWMEGMPGMAQKPKVRRKAPATASDKPRRKRPCRHRRTARARRSAPRADAQAHGSCPRAGSGARARGAAGLEGGGHPDPRRRGVRGHPGVRPGALRRAGGSTYARAAGSGDGTVAGFDPRRDTLALVGVAEARVEPVGEGEVAVRLPDGATVTVRLRG